MKNRKRFFMPAGPGLFERRRNSLSTSVTTLEHLRSAASRSRALIAQVAQSTADAIEELEQRQAAAAGGVKSYYRTFAAGDWTSGSSGATLTIAAGVHGITGRDVLCQAAALSGSAYVKNAWAAKETWASIDGNTHAITLHAAAGYAGAVLLVG